MWFQSHLFGNNEYDVICLKAIRFQLFILRPLDRNRLQIRPPPFTSIVSVCARFVCVYILCTYFDREAKQNAIISVDALDTRVRDAIPHAVGMNVNNHTTLYVAWWLRWYDRISIHTCSPHSRRQSETNWLADWTPTPHSRHIRYNPGWLTAAGA